MLKILSIVDDKKCYEEVRELRWPNGVTCPHCVSLNVIKNGHHESIQYRQRYECKKCSNRFDDLTYTVFEGHHKPLKTWIVTLYLMGLNLSNRQISKELDLSATDSQYMTSVLRSGVVERKPEPKLSKEVECDEVYIVAGHKGNPAAVKKKKEEDGEGD